jgi:thioredoxin 1
MVEALMCSMLRSCILSVALLVAVTPTLVAAPVDIVEEDFKREVLDSPRDVVVNFWAEWCGPCRAINPALTELEASMRSKVKIVSVNVDKCPNIASQYEIRSIPALMIFRAGKLVRRKLGAAPKGDLERWIESVAQE